MTTSLVAGSTRTRIIDWVRTWSAENFESSSEPRSRTVNAPCCETGLGDAEGEGEKRVASGEGEGTTAGTPVSWSALAAAGKKEANPPPTAERAAARTARVMVVKRVRRPRRARAAGPGLITSRTGPQCTPGAG